MIINSTIILCLGSFMRKEFKSELARCEGVNDIFEFPPVTTAVTEQVTCAVEVAVLRTLNAFCDPDTSIHAQRLVQLAEATSVYLQLSHEDVFLLRLAALLHDIGKVGIPAVILNKPGALDDEEWHLIHQHPEIGRQILMSAGSIFEKLSPIVVAHHEWWNGCGYPHGLRGNAIPLLARILAVVDSFDAMISDRAYGKLLSVTEACQELQRCAGYQYDPCVVAAFLAAFNARNTQVFSVSLADRQHSTDFTLVHQGCIY